MDVHSTFDKHVSDLQETVNQMRMEDRSLIPESSALELFISFLKRVIDSEPCDNRIKEMIISALLEEDNDLTGQMIEVFSILCSDEDVFEGLKYTDNYNNCSIEAKALKDEGE